MKNKGIDEENVQIKEENISNENQGTEHPKDMSKSQYNSKCLTGIESKNIYDKGIKFESK